jgi:hypothetical protein
VHCFSYLAATHTLHVDNYPKINYGVEVHATDRFMAGDGPLISSRARTIPTPMMM